MTAWTSFKYGLDRLKSFLIWICHAGRTGTNNFFGHYFILGISYKAYFGNESDMILVLTLRNLIIPWMSVCSQKTSQIAKIQSLKRIYVLLQWRWLSCQCVKIKVIPHVSCPTNWHIWSNDLFSVIIISVPSLGPKLFLWWLSDKSKSVFYARCEYSFTHH